MDRFEVSVVLLLLVASVVAFGGEKSSDMMSENGATVLAVSSHNGCNRPENALGPSAWASASCSLTTEESDCRLPSTDPAAPSFCEVFHQCGGWSPAPTDAAPFIEVGFELMTDVSYVVIGNEGSRGWITKVTLEAGDPRRERVIFEAPKPWRPPEKHRVSASPGKTGPFLAPGLDYRGAVSTATNGTLCVSWSLQHGIPLKSETGLGDHNYCRNPNNDPLGAWCFTAPNATGKQYCTIPVAESVCPFVPTLFSFSPPLTGTFSSLRIEMQPFTHAISAITEIQIVGKRVLSCYDDPQRGHWSSPRCETCLFPWKGYRCNELKCFNNAPCVNGNCRDDGTCECVGTWIGANCSLQCPGSPTACSGHGTCQTDGTCACDPYFATADCSVECPKDAGTPHCGGSPYSYGRCNDGASGNGTCTCLGGFSGASCNLPPCNNQVCEHGQCSGLSCICHSDDIRGHWSGPTCQVCDPLYSGVACTIEMLETKTLTISGVAPAALNFVVMPLSRITSTVTFLGDSASQIITVTQAIGYYAQSFALDKTTPTGTVTLAANTLNTAGTAYAQDAQVRFSAVDQLQPTTPWQGSKLRLTLRYAPACTEKCGLHGFCGAPPTVASSTRRHLSSTPPLPRSFNGQSVTPCDTVDLRDLPYCDTNAAFNATTKRCQCDSGYVCDNVTQRICVRVSTARAASTALGTCQCDDNDDDGHWTGPACSQCLAPYFGPDCRLQCKNGATLNSTGTGCVCRSGTFFRGIDCSECPTEDGYAFGGADCNIAAPTRTFTRRINVDAGVPHATSLFNKYPYVPLSIRITLLNGATRNELLSAFVNLFTTIPVATPRTEAPSGDSLPEFVVPSSSAPKSVFDCKANSSGNATVVDCTVIPSADILYFDVNFTLARTAPVDLDITTLLHWACSYKGLRTATGAPTCLCVSDITGGFFDQSSDCSACSPGFTGTNCLRPTFTSSMVATEYNKQLMGGEAVVFALNVEPNSAYDVSLDCSAGDCDLEVQTMPRCRDGWTFFRGRCYHVFHKECVTVEEAEKRCGLEGGRLAQVETLVHLPTFRRMLRDAGLADHRREFCSRKVAFGNRRRIPVCTANHPDRPTTVATCEAYDECTWDFFAGACVVRAEATCAGTTRTSCVEIAGQRRKCDFAHIGPDPAATTCLPSYEAGDAWQSMSRDMERIDYSAMPIVDCNTAAATEATCAALLVCEWSGTACVPSAFATSNAYLRTSHDYLAFTRTDFTCSSLLYVPTRGLFVWAPVPCTDTQRSSRTASKRTRVALESPYQLYMCERNESVVPVSFVSGTGIISAAASAKVSAPQCTQVSASGQERCTGAASRDGEILLVRAVSLAFWTPYAINITYVPRRKINDDNYDGASCTNTAEGGSWAGELCDQCAPRYSGAFCTTFTSCALNPSECGSHGTCNVATGYCTCATDYYGKYCDAFCDSTTCGVGTCNADYQKCSRIGATRPCPLRSLCICPGEVAGTRCETCVTGYYDVSTDAFRCMRTCQCNGYPCDPQTGTCFCTGGGSFSSYPFYCSCSAGYYGRECKTQCNSG